MGFTNNILLDALQSKSRGIKRFSNGRVLRSKERTKAKGITLMKNDCGWEDCFTCPYPDCIMGIGIKKVSLGRKKKAINLKNSGMWPKEIATVLGVSQRSIERYLQGQVRERQKYIVNKYKEG